MNIIQDILPAGSSNRPRTRLNATYITVHETANTSRGADALAHSKYIKGSSARDRKVSWHFTVDSKSIYQHLPISEVGWHAGVGNSQSIGIELCVNSDGNFEQTKKNAQWLINKLMKDLNIPLSRIVTHKHWTGKNCPAKLLPTFNTFKEGIVKKVDQSKTAPKQVDNTPDAWAKESWEKANKKIGKDGQPILDGSRPKETMTRQELAKVLDRLGVLD